MGPRSKGENVIKPFLDLKPAVQNITVLPWSHVDSDTSSGSQVAVCKKGHLHSIFTLGLKNVDVATWISVFKRFSDFVTATPDAGKSTILIEFFPTQAVLAVPDEATAYPWRDVQLQMYGLPYLLLSFASVNYETSWCLLTICTHPYAASSH